MSASSENQSPDVQHEPFDGAAVLAKVQALCDEVVEAWQERAVVLNKYEQELLRSEIVKVGELLLGLVGKR